MAVLSVAGLKLSLNQWLIIHLLEWLFGKGLLYTYDTDSLPEWLLLQGGIVSLVSFYSLMVWAWCHDRQARLFYLVILVSSLTLKLLNCFQ